MNLRGFIRISFIAAPAFLFLYGIAHILDSLDGSYGPGVAWIVGHILFLFGLVMFGFVIVGLYLRVQDGALWHKIVARCAMAVGLVGLIIFIRSPIIDIVAGLRALNNAALGAFQTQLNAYPVAAFSPYYNFGPLLFQLGLLILMIQVTSQKPRKLPWWSPALLLLGFLVLGFDLNLLLVGAILIGIALMPVGSRV